MLFRSLPQVKSLNLYRSSYYFSYVNAKFFPEIPITIQASDLNHLYYFSHWKQNADTNHLTTIYPGKSNVLDAVYIHKPYSTLKKSLIVAKLFFEQSKKDTLFTIGIMNIGNDSLENINLQYACNYHSQNYTLRIPKIRVGEILYFTNKPKKSSKLLTTTNYNQIYLPEGFDYRGGQVVFADEHGAILDSLYINVPDTAARYNHLIKATRNIHNGKWMFGKYEIDFKIPEPQRKDEYKLLIVGSLLLLVTSIGFIIRRRNRKIKKPVDSVTSV